jgi:hypothetical protein
MADYHYPPLAQPREATENRLIVGKSAIPRQGNEFIEYPGNIMVEMRPVRVARHLRLLPGRQLGIGFRQHFFGPLLQLRDLGIYIELA